MVIFSLFGVRCKTSCKMERIWEIPNPPIASVRAQVLSSLIHHIVWLYSFLLQMKKGTGIRAGFCMESRWEELWHCFFTRRTQPSGTEPSLLHPCVRYLKPHPLEKGLDLVLSAYVLLGPVHNVSSWFGIKRCVQLMHNHFFIFFDVKPCTLVVHRS